MICEHCKVSFDQREGSGRPKVYCSRDCSRKATYLAKRSRATEVDQCKFCGKDFIVQHAGQQFCNHSCSSMRNALSAGKQLREQGPCLRCGALCSPGRSYCGSKCASLSQRINRTCEGCGKEFWRKIAGGGGDTGRFCSKACSTPVIQLEKRARRMERQKDIGFSPTYLGRFSPVEFSRCFCGKPFRVCNGRTACSVICSYRKSTLVEKRLVTTACVECGNHFQALSSPGRPVRSTCGDKCDRRIARRKRRAVQQAAVIEGGKQPTLQYLLKCSGGRCALCGLKVSIDAARTFAGPSLDHIVPLARGGAHDISNAQIAHHYCNTLKSDGRQHSQSFYRDAINGLLFQYVKNGIGDGGYPLAL